MRTAFLIRGGCVLTLGNRTPNLVEGDVLVEDGRIVEVARGLRARNADVIDAAGTIVMPGFVDTHRHLWRSLFRNIGQEPAVGADPRVLGPDDVYAATLLGLLSAAACGTTTVVDWADAATDEPCREAAFQAHVDSGLRGVLVSPGTADDASADGVLGATEHPGGTDRVHLAYASPVVTLAEVDRLTEPWSRARGAGLRIHVHADGSEPGLVAGLAERQLLGRDVTVAHGSGLDGRELDAIAASGAAIALTPASQMGRGGGAPSVQALIDHDLRPGLGVDEEGLAPGDHFSQMRSIQSIQHAVLFDRKLAGKGSLPNLLTTRDVIRYATCDGARAVGLGDTTGSLEPGKRADVIVLRADTPNVAPVNDPIGAVVWAMDPSNVDTVFVDGRPLVRDGQLDADVERARSLALAARDRLVGADDELVDAGSGGSG